MLVSYLPIAIVIGFAISLIVVLYMKRQLKSVHTKKAAADYVVNDSLDIVEHRDVYRYHQVRKTPKPKNESSNN